MVPDLDVPDPLLGLRAQIHVFQCSCGSAVLFDEPRPPWPEHDCAETGTIGRSGLKGWVAIDVLRANVVPINTRIMDMAFPPAAGNSKKSSPAVEPIKAMQAKAGTRINLLALVRELAPDTKKTRDLAGMTALGAKLLQLPKGELWQATLVVNNEEPNLSYTCIVPASLGLPKDAKNKMVFAQLEGRGAGGHEHWCVTEIRLI